MKIKNILLFLLFAVPYIAFGSVETARFGVDFSISDARPEKVEHSANLKISRSSSSLNFYSATALSADWQRCEIRFTPDRHGEVTLVLSSSGVKNSFAAAFDDIRISGAEKVRNGSFEELSAGVFDHWTAAELNMKTDRPDAADGKNYIIVSSKLTAKQRIAVYAGTPVVISFCIRHGGKLPRPPRRVKLPEKQHPRSYYRLYNNKIKLLPLADKGVKPEEIEPLTPRLTALKEPPRASFSVPENFIHAKTDFLKVPVTLREENGMERDCTIRFGFPLAQGKFYNLSSFRLLDKDSREIPVQFSVLAWWPDRSIKSVLVQFKQHLKANEKLLCFISAGEKLPPRRTFAPSPLQYTEDFGKITVSTGKLRADINKLRFNLLENISVNGKPAGGFAPSGIILVNEHGEEIELSGSPSLIKVEEYGPERLTFRIDGTFTRRKRKYLNSSCRLTFYANSAAVEMELRFINTALKSEFNDFTSLTARFLPVSHPQTLVMNGYRAGRIFQHHDRKLQFGSNFNTDRISGAGEAVLKQGKITFNLFKAALRYPKAFSVNGNALEFELLPRLPGKDFGNDLPWYLRFPFCEGFYRLKWGMGFREKLTIDFSGETPAAVLGADDIIPLIDRTYLSSTGVYPGIAPESGGDFTAWDDAALSAFSDHMQLKEKQREYGFLNYGDWFGERRRNWGNNEYDLAQGLFLLFLRTGKSEIFRWAKLAAIHQADTDIIHAYPDPAFVGANAQHGIGHTGNSYQKRNPAPWSLRLDESFLGSNGHTWCEGMLSAWMLSGDAATMDSALLLGEHLKRWVAPRFHRLGNHERTGGWSSRALLALYNTTGEKDFLRAAKRIYDCILAEQKFHLGGAWPHKLPAGHNGGTPYSFGNCPYLVSILLDTLRNYSLISPSEQLTRSIIAASRWQLSCFEPLLSGWPYGASWQGKAYNNVSSYSNMMIGAGLASGARMARDSRMYAVAKAVAADGIRNGCGATGKELGIYLIFLGTYIDELCRFATENPKEEPFKYSPGMVKHFQESFQPPPERLRRCLPDRFRVRGGRAKEFRIRLKSDTAEITISRRPCGAKTNSAPLYSARLLRMDGSEVAAFSGESSSKARLMKVILTALRKDELFRLLIDDDFMGEWHVEGDPAKTHISSMILKNYTFLSNSGGISAFLLKLPPELNDFELKVMPQHGNIARIYLLDEAGNQLSSAIMTQYRRSPPWEVKNTDAPGIRWKNQPGKVFKIVTFGSGDIHLSAPAGTQLMLHAE